MSTARNNDTPATKPPPMGRQKPIAKVTSAALSQEEPTFRSMAIQHMARPITRGAVPHKYDPVVRPSQSHQLENQFIDKDDYFSKSAPVGASSESPAGKSNWKVKDAAVRFLPTYYPLEKTSRFLTGEKPSIIACRIADACRALSVQGKFDSELGTASLLTSELVEIHLSLWLGGAKFPNKIIVEAQRRRGDPVTYHKYCRRLLDSASGDFQARGISSNEKRERMRQNITEELLGAKSSASSERENALLALEIADSLLKKDRMDARQLGIESLCLLTDPARAGMETALLASRVVLLGAAHDESADDENYFMCGDFKIRKAILSLVQFGRLGDDDGDFIDSDDESDNEHPEDKEQNDVLHNLALAVLANSLDVLEKHGNKLGTSRTPPSSVANTFLDESKEISNQDILGALLGVLKNAGEKPHDACLSAKCLRSLCDASRDARRRTRELQAKTIVKSALEVGLSAHANLQAESEKLIVVLEKNDDDDEEDSGYN